MHILCRSRMLAYAPAGEPVKRGNLGFGAPSTCATAADKAKIKNPLKPSLLFVDKPAHFLDATASPRRARSLACPKGVFPDSLRLMR
jgi:hypothetical protein